MLFWFDSRACFSRSVYHLYLELLLLMHEYSWGGGGGGGGWHWEMHLALNTEADKCHNYCQQHTAQNNHSLELS